MARKEDLKRNTKRKKRKDITPFIIIGVIVVIIVGVIILSTYQPVGEINDPDLTKAAITDGLTMGDPNAPIKVVEFADFQCPGCGYYQQSIEPTIIANYVDTGLVYFTYSPFSFLGAYGTDPDWDESIKASEAAYCANEQGKFWEYRAYLYGNQDGENQGAFVRKRLIAFADKLNLNSSAFTECLDSDKYYQTVMDANDYAQNSGLTYTPSFLVGDQIVGANDLEATLYALVNQ